MEKKKKKKTMRFITRTGTLLLLLRNLLGNSEGKEWAG